MNTRVESVPVVRQTVLNGRVVAAVIDTRLRVVSTRKDGTEYVVFRGRRCEVVRGLAVVLS